MSRSPSNIGVFNDLTVGSGNHVHSFDFWVGDTTNPGVPSIDTIAYNRGEIVAHPETNSTLWVAVRDNDNVEPTEANSDDWQQISGGDGVAITIADTPPASPAQGQQWIQNNSGREYTANDDGSWVQTGGPGIAETSTGTTVTAGSFDTGQDVVATAGTGNTVALNLSAEVRQEIADKGSSQSHEHYLQSLAGNAVTVDSPATRVGLDDSRIGTVFVFNNNQLQFSFGDGTPTRAEVEAVWPVGQYFIAGAGGSGAAAPTTATNLLRVSNIEEYRGVYYVELQLINGVDFNGSPLNGNLTRDEGNDALRTSLNGTSRNDANTGFWRSTVSHEGGFVNVADDGTVSLQPSQTLTTAERNAVRASVILFQEGATGAARTLFQHEVVQAADGALWKVAADTGASGMTLTQLGTPADDNNNFTRLSRTDAGGGLVAEGFTNMPLNRADLVAGDYTVVINYTGATQAAGAISASSFSVDGVTPDSVTPTNITTGINEYTITLSAANINNILLNPGVLNDVTFDPPGDPVAVELTVQGNSSVAPIHEQNLITGTSSLPSRATDRLGEGARYTLNVFNRTETTLVFRNDGTPANINTTVEIDVGTTVRVAVTAANISLAASAGATVVDITAGNTGNLTFTLTEEQVNMLQEVAAPLVANNQYTAGQEFRYNNSSFRVLAGQTFTYTGNVQDLTATQTALTNGISNGMLETFVQDPSGHTDNLYVTFGGVRYPIVHTDEDDIAELQSEITANENAIVGVGERIDSLTNRVDSLFYANSIEHYDESAQGLVSSAFRDVSGTPYDGHSQGYLRSNGNIAFNNNGAYHPFPTSDAGGGVTLPAGSRLVNSLGDTTEHGNLDASILLDGPNNHRNSGLATVSWMNGAGNPLFNHLYERRFQEAGTLMWFPLDLTGFGDRTFVNPIVPINGVDHVVGVDTDAIQIPGGLNVYDPATNQLVPGISRASVTGSGVTTQINFQDADGNSATLPGGQLYFITYLPDYSLGPNNNYVNKDSEYENLLIVMNHIHDTQTFPTMREAWRQALLSGWQIRYPTSYPVFMGGVTAILVQLALPGQRFNVNGLGTHNGFDFAITNTSTNPDIEGTIGPNGQIRIWDSPANLDRIERFLNSVPATNTIHCHFTNRNTDGSVNDFTEAAAIALFRGDDPTRPFVNGNTGTAPILGLARRQNNAIVDQALSNGNFSGLGQRDVSFIDLYLDRNLRNFPDPGTTVTLIDDRAGGLLANPFNGDTTTSTHTVAGSTTFNRGVDFEYQVGQAYDAGAVIYTGTTGIPSANQNMVFRVNTAITAAANTQFSAVVGSLVAIGGGTGGGGGGTPADDSVGFDQINFNADPTAAANEKYVIGLLNNTGNTGFEPTLGAVNVTGNGLNANGGSTISVGQGNGITVGADNVAVRVAQDGVLGFNAGGDLRINTTANITAASVVLGGWTITETAGSLTFAQGGNTNMRLNADGSLEVRGDISAMDTDINN